MPPLLPHIGLVLLRAEWFDTVVALPELRYAMEQDAAAIVAALTPQFTLHGPWVVSTAESFDRTTAAIRAADLDLLVLCFQVWAEDRALPALLRAAGDMPLAIWCYTPWDRPPRPAPFVEVLRGSGPVGTLEGLGVIHNMGRRYSFTRS